MHNNNDEHIQEELENRRDLLEEIIMCKLVLIDLEITTKELTKCVAKIDVKKMEMLKLNQQADEVKAQKEILQKEFEEFQKSFDVAIKSEDQAELYEGKLLAMHAAMMHLEEQQEILCDRMEEIVKNYKALNAELKGFEGKVFGNPRAEEEK